MLGVGGHVIDGVDLGHEQKGQGHDGAGEHCQRQQEGALGVPGRREVGGDEGQPQDDGGVHQEAGEARLVVVVRQLPGLDGVEGAHDHQTQVAHEGEEEARARQHALQLDVLLGAVGHHRHRVRRVHQDTREHNQHLKKIHIYKMSVTSSNVDIFC